MKIEDNRIQIYVAINGSDQTGDGSFAHPFATVPAAQAVVREKIAAGGLTADAVICIRGGTYYLQQPIVIGPSDCDERFQVHYTNYCDEIVRLVGGIPITGWTDPDENGVCQADVAGNANFYTMFEDNVRLTPAREKNWAGKSVHDPSHLQAAYGSASSWFGEVLKVNSVDGNHVTTDITPCVWSGGLEYLQGAREFISEAGEWAIEENTVYYKPLHPDHIGVVVAGTAENIFLLKGETDHPVRNITICGLWMEKNAFGENLAAHARPNNVLAEYESNLQGLVTLIHTENVTVMNCKLDHAGYVGVVLSGYAQHNTVCGNDIRNAGYAGIFLIGENPGSLHYCSKQNIITNNRIKDVGIFVGHGAGMYLINSGENQITHNEISDVPRYGISMKGMRYGVFADNGLGDVPFEDHWKYNQTTGNYFGYNKIYNTGIRSGDGGGIEGWGMGRDNHIDHNIIYNAYRGIATENWRGHSIFLDDAAHHTKVTNNIIYDENAVSVNAGIFIKSIDNYVVNNVFDVGYAKNGAADIQPYICPAGDSVFEHNIVYSGIPGTLYDDGTWSGEGNGDRIMLYFGDRSNTTETPSLQSLQVMNHNLYYNAVGKAQIRVEDSLLSVDEWKTCRENVCEYDADSISADPLFVDAKNHDYRLPPDSPALKLGIQSIDASTIGLLPDFRYVEE